MCAAIKLYCHIIYHDRLLRKLTAVDDDEGRFVLSFSEAAGSCFLGAAAATLLLCFVLRAEFFLLFCRPRRKNEE
jgi:hypothetical protein